MKLARNFIAGKMNKVVDERLLPEGEYIDAMNIRMGDTEKSEVGVIENTKGNIPLTTLAYNGIQLSTDALCIGSYADSANETLYWFVHDPNFSGSPITGILDLVVSYNTLSGILTYNIVSINDGGGVKTTLNFNPKYLITGVNLISESGLFLFTDFYNDPRCINVNRSYSLPSVGGIDTITSEQLMVIKRPPTESPVVVPVLTGGQEVFMQERFISFAYRYKYIDGEYSATSQWSQVAFVPNSFAFSIASMLNEGMVNSCNQANITFNTGGPLVVGIDLLFKQSSNNIIKVIEKLDKHLLGYADNSLVTYNFSNSKIFTILSEGEILRLYDNVPLLAKGQTIMGNRLMYGNYIEGYDMIDKNGDPVRLEYQADAISEPIGSSTLPSTTGTATYTINGTVNIVNGIAYIDLSGVNTKLKAGSALNISFTLNHSAFSGGVTYPAQTTTDLNITFSFYLTNNYSSVYALASSAEFLAAVGTAANINPVYSPTIGVPTSCDGTTLTDQVNCDIPDVLGSFYKFASGISAPFQGINIITTTSSNSIGFQFQVMEFVDNLSAPALRMYEYYAVGAVSAKFQAISNPKSLHSNRGYEIGIVYMDGFNRATTALVSSNNAVHVPCGDSPNKNSIQITIPTTQLAPSWAKRYKFVIKPDAQDYEVIYCNTFFRDVATNEAWFLLEGENATKVEVGDRYIVKSDTTGPLPNCAYATVLEKAAKEANFITPVGGGTVFSGVYMKINPDSFSTVAQPNAVIKYGTQSMDSGYGGGYGHGGLPYLTSIYYGAGYDSGHPLWQYGDYNIPAGSKVYFKFDWHRTGTGSKCEQLGYLLEKTYVSSKDYDNMYDWFVGDNIAATLNTGHGYDSGTTIAFNPLISPSETYINAAEVMTLQFWRDSTTNKLALLLSIGHGCTGWHQQGRKYQIHATIEVYRALTTLVFETQPTDALPDVFFENNLSFGIDDSGYHLGNVQDQSSSLPAIIDTGFFNCFAFGNGVESYKIRDSLIGRPFNLGERVTSVSAQDYKKANRFCDITYSGIYNAETNLNKLNEFNLGLLNFKHLESSFGNIFILDGRETDVLVLQEDKISYVLAGKNLLSDAAAGGALTSVPDVLGTQIARTEKYGISFNPESYVHWGFDRYFTDVKRGVVIQLKGNAYSNDQLSVISEVGMRTWFRDEFNVAFSTQKLGGFDPYMNEYVFSTNDRSIPVVEGCLGCGVQQTFNLSNLSGGEKVYTFCVSLGAMLGNVTVEWGDIINPSSDDFVISANYNGVITSSGATGASGAFTFLKDNISVDIVTITIGYTSPSLVLNLLVGCPEPEQLKVVQVVLTANADVGKTLHVGYRYVNGVYTGPLLQNQVLFLNSITAPTVSWYNVNNGNVGSGAFPPEGSVLTLQSNQISPDTFVFDPLNDRFRYLRSNTLYANTPSDINSLLAASTIATPIVGSTPNFSADFVVPDSIYGNILYLIWDLRASIPVPLCYESKDAINPRKDVCCTCFPCETPCVLVRLQNMSSVNSSEIYFPAGISDTCVTTHGDAVPISITLDPSETLDICLNNDTVSGFQYTVLTGISEVTILQCGCAAPCTERCSQWFYINQSGVDVDIAYKDCDCLDTHHLAPAGKALPLSVCRDTIPTLVGGAPAGSSLVLTKYCGVCTFDSGSCYTFEVYNVLSTVTVTYKDCGGATVVVVVNPEEIHRYCVKTTFIPVLSDITQASIRIIGDGCSCE